MAPTLETPRLLLRPLVLEDTEEMQELFPHWEIVRYLSAVVPWPYPADGALRYVRDQALPAVERGEAWHFTLRRKAAPEGLVGAIGLFSAGSDNRGFWVALPFQGRGYATEACSAATAYWFEVLGQKSLRVRKAIANEASRRISAREGMRVVERVESDFVSGRLPAEIWEISAEEWRARRAG
ncbi:MAG TPA: GNAT family N-acetyltransferase [Anaeromyxobacter sp.]|nr:GNAT family N-acetyltransferase [Anaeromyxobacter sp.]